ncbi:MAG TPA: hypothetical protein V6C98_08280 [Thermosynechococcaceae cyanobacterium]
MTGASLSRPTPTLNPSERLYESVYQEYLFLSTVIDPGRWLQSF